MTQAASPRIIIPPPSFSHHQSSPAPYSHLFRQEQFDGSQDSVASTNAQPLARYPHSRAHLIAKAKASAAHPEVNSKSVLATAVLLSSSASSSSTAQRSATASRATSPLPVPTTDAPPAAAALALAPASASSALPLQIRQAAPSNYATVQGSLPFSAATMQSQPRTASPFTSFSPSSLPTERHFTQTGFPPSTSSPAPFTSLYAVSPEPSKAELSIPSSYPPASLPFDSGSHIHRTNTLSPASASYQQQQLRHGQLSPLIQSPQNQGSSLVGVSLSRSVSADAVASPQPSAHLAQRLAQQNKHIRDAWEAERNYLEANRRRAEEVYQEERVIMEEERDNWEREKAEMQQEIQALRERVQRLEGENSTLKTLAAHNVPMSGVGSPMLSQRGGTADNYFDGGAVPAGVPLTSVPQHVKLPTSRLSPPAADASQLPPGLENAARRPHFASPGGGASRQSPTAQPESSPFIPLDPSMQPQGPRSSVPDFLGPSDETPENQIPVIDVQEIDPKLEGIPIKATAVQKSWFGEATSSKASPATSPPSDQPTQPKRFSSRDQTLQVLKAEESERRTMHAGHTPNHSLSLFPTVNVTAGTTVSGFSEGTTPTAAQSSAPTEHHDEPGQQADAPVAKDSEAKNVEPVSDGDELPPLEPTEDPPLKGPLMIKNIPAQDEIFWSLVNKKLAPISEGHDALPTVMRAGADEQAAAGPSDLTAAVGADTSLEQETAADEESPNGKKGIEDPVPLKFKTTTNFGAPFGAL